MLFVMLFDIVNIIWRLLINVVVDPVGIKQIGMGTPRDQRWIIRIIAKIVILWQVNIVAHATVTLILIVERVGRILQMASDKELAAVAGHHHAYAAVRRLGYQR